MYQSWQLYKHKSFFSIHEGLVPGTPGMPKSAVSPAESTHEVLALHIFEGSASLKYCIFKCALVEKTKKSVRVNPCSSNPCCSIVNCILKSKAGFCLFGFCFSAVFILKFHISKTILVYVCQRI